MLIGSTHKIMDSLAVDYWLVKEEGLEKEWRLFCCVMKMAAP